jgi:selenocysteine-specific elongation factor
VHVVATAGHVDHGKSTLVIALTGMDPDRFTEEKERGLTIDLGFAWTVLPSGRELAFVDVPGHVRFIKNMLAGVGAVDACLFVVAATEGWKPQSEEHLRILELLGVRFGLVALTKVGGLDADEVELRRMEVSERVAGTFLASCDIVAVDGVAGTGIDELRTALDRSLAGTPTSVDRDRPRLWVDRVFAAKGAGTVVTGTLAGGSLAIGDELVVTPAGSPVRVRGLQSHQREREVVGPGHRVAVNLSGVGHDRVGRGDAVVRPRQWTAATTIDCELRVLGTLDHEVSRRGAYQAYLGSGEHAVRLRVLGAEAIPPGSAGLVRLHLPAALPLLPGDRYVLRESGRGETVGGGEVLDVAPVLAAARARPTRSAERVVAERGWVQPEELDRLTGERRPATVGRWVVDPGALEQTTTRVRELVADAGPLGLDVAGLGERERAVLELLDDVTVTAGRARVSSRGSDDGLAAHPWVRALEADPFTPPPPSGVGRDELRELTRRGLVVERDGCWFAASAVDEAARTVAELLTASPGGVTVSAVRDALGTSRKYLLPLLNHLDASGVTRRRGDVRVAGPRLPR